RKPLALEPALRGRDAPDPSPGQGRVECGQAFQGGDVVDGDGWHDWPPRPIGTEMRTIAFLATVCLHSQIPHGSYHFEDHMDDCGPGTEPIKVAVTVTVEGRPHGHRLRRHGSP